MCLQEQMNGRLGCLLRQAKHSDCEDVVCQLSLSLSLPLWLLRRGVEVWYYGVDGGEAGGNEVREGGIEGNCLTAWLLASFFDGKFAHRLILLLKH